MEIFYNYEKLKARIVSSGRTQSEVAEAAGMTLDKFLRRLENLEEFTHQQIISISDYLGICHSDIHSFFFETTPLMTTEEAKVVAAHTLEDEIYSAEHTAHLMHTLFERLYLDTMDVLGKDKTPSDAELRFWASGLLDSMEILNLYVDMTCNELCDLLEMSSKDVKATRTGT